MYFVFFIIYALKKKYKHRNGSYMEYFHKTVTVQHTIFDMVQGNRFDSLQQHTDFV